jgi:hypothetical protein
MITRTLRSNPVAALGNPLDLNTADNWLHLGSAVVGLVIAVLPARKVVQLDEDLVSRDMVSASTPEPVVDREDRGDPDRADLTCARLVAQLASSGRVTPGTGTQRA